MPNIFVAAGEEWNGGYMDSMRFLGLEVTDSVSDFHAFPEEFAMVLFTGGADITPSVYGHEKSKLTRNSEMRDYHEKYVFKTAVEYDIPMVGICRGLQWLNVMAGGFMIQHADGHNLVNNHHVKTYENVEFAVNTLHHQMCVPPPNAFVLAVASRPRSSRYMIDGRKTFENPIEIEACYYQNINAFGVQWHPEGYACPPGGIDFWQEHVQLLFDGKLIKKLVQCNAPRQKEFGNFNWKDMKYKFRYGHALSLASKSVEVVKI